MRVLGHRPGFMQRVLPWLVALLVFVLLAVASVWVRQQDAARRGAEARAEAAQVELAQAQASLTALAAQLASASATAVAQANDPARALKQALDLVFEAYKQPSEAHFSALAQAFTASGRTVFQPEAEHLVSSGRHLGGQSRYTLDVLSTTPKGPDTVEIRTRELWIYDERDDANRPTRCVREESEQTYTLERRGRAWLVSDVQLGPSQRSDC